VDLRHEHIVLETDRYRVEGNLTLPGEGFRSRLSDFVNQRDREFLSIQDAVITTLDAPHSEERVPFVMVGRRHVRVMTPLDPAAQQEAAGAGSGPATPE
jgi:hypothetical protein